MIGWIANILIVVAIMFIGRKQRIGWIFSIIGNLLWCIYAVQLNLWSALFIDGLTMIIGIYSWRKWKNDS